MTAVSWYVLCLPAFFIHGLAFALLEGENDAPCGGSRFDTCEGGHRQRVIDATSNGFGRPVFVDICSSIKELISCSTNACGDIWDPTTDLVTQQLQFSEATGICGGESRTNRCSRRIAKKCLRKMSRSVQKTGDFCAYYFAYANCAIKEFPACADDSATAFAEAMRMQVLAKFLVVIGGREVKMCPSWPVPEGSENSVEGSGDVGPETPTTF